MYYVCYVLYKFWEQPPRCCLHPEGAKRLATLEGDSTLGETLLSGEANAGNPLIRVGVEGLEDAQLVLLLCDFRGSEALQLLAEVESANLCISVVEEEEHVLLLILDCVEFGGS